MNTLLFLIFYNIAHFSGRGLIKLYKTIFARDFDIKNFYVSKNITLETFYSLFFLFFCGNYLFLFNFFAPIKFAIPSLLIFLLIFFIYGFIDIKSNKLNSFQFIINNVVFPLLVGISSYGIRFHYDAGAYHLGTQNWLYNSKISFGLVNINTFYSYANLNEYLSSALWVINNFLYSHFLHLIFFVVFYSYLHSTIRQNENFFLRNVSILILIYSIIDNIGIGGGSNGFIQIQTIGKQDTAVGILIFFTFIVFINDSINSSFTKKGFAFIGFSSFLAFQLKITAALLLIIILVYLYNLLKNSHSILFKETIALLLLFIFWSIKSFIISSCFIFPVLSTCNKNVSWSAYSRIKSAKNGTIEGNYAYRFGDNLFQWLNEWINIQFSFQIFSNFLFSLVFILVIRNLLFNKKNIYKIHKNHLITSLLFLLINIFFFFTSVPVYRNGFGIFLAIVAVFGLGTEDFKVSIKIVPVFWSILLILSMAALPRGYMYKEFLNQPSTLNELQPNKEFYLHVNDTKWVYSTNNQCWASLNCTSKNRIILEYSLGKYKMFANGNS
jgi:hypothetical protein